MPAQVGEPVWLVVWKGIPQGVYATREEARVAIRALKPFSHYVPKQVSAGKMVPEEVEEVLSPEIQAKLDILGRPWNRFTKVLRDVYDLER